MWFELVDGTIRFTHTNTRAKYRNLLRNPSMSLAVYDPENPYRYIEVRGRLVEATPDPTGGFYQRLARRYGQADPAAPEDADKRVILVMSIDKVIGRRHDDSDDRRIVRSDPGGSGGSARGPELTRA